MKFYAISSLCILIILHSVHAEVVSSGSRNTIISSSTISESGEYFLGRDISGPITISVSDVVIDLNSFVIDGGTNGIASDGFNNITIKNGTIRNSLEEGIIINNAQNIHLDNLLIENGGSDGVSITTCTALILQSCQIQGFSAQGLRLSDLTTARIENSIFNNNTSNGVLASAQINTQIINCVISNNSAIGISFSDSSRNSIACNIKSCQVFANALDGITISGPSLNPSINFNVIDCIIESNGTSPAFDRRGVLLSNVNSSVIQNCTVQNNVAIAILMQNCEINTILQCIVNQNSLGIFLDNCNNTCVKENVANNNGNVGSISSGIEFQTCSDAAVKANIANNNAFAGISMNVCSNFCVKENITNGNVRGIINQVSTNNVFFLNKAQLNTDNFDGLSPSPIATFSLGTGGFTGTPGTFDNIAVIP